MYNHNSNTKGAILKLALLVSSGLSIYFRILYALIDITIFSLRFIDVIIKLVKHTKPNEEVKELNWNEKCFNLLARKSTIYDKGLTQDWTKSSCRLSQFS